MTVTTLFVPFHLDESRPDLADDLPAAVPDRPWVTVSPPLPQDDDWARFGVVHEAVAVAVAQALSAAADGAADGAAGPTVDVVSGDCLVALGVVAGVQRAGIDPAVVWFDAHGDVQTVETTASGYPGGMPLRILAGYRPPRLAGPEGLRPVAEERLVLVGARDLDPPEVQYLASAAVRRLDVEEVGAGSLPDGPLVLHVDLDVIDPSDLPGMAFAAPGGAPASVVLAAVRRVLDTGRVAALSVAATWGPGRAGEVPERTALLGSILRGA